MSSVPRVVKSSPITEKGVFLYSSREGRTELAISTGPRYYSRQDYELLHSCSPHFLTAPLYRQIKSREQMPNNSRHIEIRLGRMGIEAFNAFLENVGLAYGDLDDRSKYKVLKKAGVWALPEGKRGPKSGKTHSKKRD
jgi:hypothetical protein